VVYVWLELVLLSFMGLGLWRFLWTDGHPEKYRRMLVPSVIGELTLSGTDWKGMVL